MAGARLAGGEDVGLEVVDPHKRQPVRRRQRRRGAEADAEADLEPRAHRHPDCALCGLMQNVYNICNIMQCNII